MSRLFSRPPYIGRVDTRPWRQPDGTTDQRVVLIGIHGIVAALTPAEAYNLANQITDHAETLERNAHAPVA